MPDVSVIAISIAARPLSEFESRARLTRMQKDIAGRRLVVLVANAFAPIGGIVLYIFDRLPRCFQGAMI